MITTKGKTFTIERSKWLRGEGSDRSKLLREEDGKMCCLGQVMRQLGFSNETLMDQGAPTDVDGDCPVEALVELDSEEVGCDEDGDPIIERTRGSHEAVYSMMSVNDEPGSDELREKQLSELAQQAGFSLKFVD